MVATLVAFVAVVEVDAEDATIAVLHANPVPDVHWRALAEVEHEGTA